MGGRVVASRCWSRTVDTELLLRFAFVALLVIGLGKIVIWSLDQQAAPIPERAPSCAGLLRAMNENDGWISEAEASREEIAAAERDGYIQNDGLHGNGYLLTKRGRKALALWSDRDA